MNEKIFVTLSTFVEYDSKPLDLLKASGYPFVLNTTGKRVTTPQLIEMGKDAAVFVAGVEPYDVPTLEQLPLIKCISRCGAGVDAIDLNAAKQKNIAVLNTPNAPTEAVAELALTMMLALLHNLTKQMRVAKEWKRLDAHLLAGKRVGIVGLGRIGKRVIELLKPFHVSMVVSDPNADPSWAAANSVTLVTLDQLLSSCDIVSLHAAKSADHPLLLGREQLAKMKQGALLINLARGNMVDEVALCEALESGHLWGAGLDVYPQEPYSGMLCDFDNVVLTPHSATFTIETRVAMEVECVDKALRFLRGEIREGERVI
jgi:D-3-phosphoglycerate dehydrogenase